MIQNYPENPRPSESNNGEYVPAYVPIEQVLETIDDLTALEAQRIILDQDDTNELCGNRELYRQVEEQLKQLDMILVRRLDNTISFVPRSQFLPDNGYLIHFNIASAKNSPHIEPLPLAHDTISTRELSMIEGQKQYVLEMEVAVVGILENGVMRPQYIGTIVDFGDRTPRIDGTGRTYKTWTPGIEHGGSTGASTTWLAVDTWDQIQHVDMEYWVYDQNGGEVLHTPNADADTLKLWGKRLGDWVGNYPPEKLQAIGIQEGVPFLISTGQILFEDDGARSIAPDTTPSFRAYGRMKVGSGIKIETDIVANTYPKTEETFAPTQPPFSYYE